MIYALIGHHIHGQMQDSANERFINIFYRAPDRVQANVVSASEATHNVVASALQSIAAWLENFFSRCSRVIFKFKEFFDRHQDELEEVIRRVRVKTISDAKGEVTHRIENIEYTCVAQNLLKTEFKDRLYGGIDNWNLHQQRSVCAGFTPINFSAVGDFADQLIAKLLCIDPFNVGNDLLGDNRHGAIGHGGTQRQGERLYRRRRGERRTTDCRRGQEWLICRRDAVR